MHCLTDKDPVHSFLNKKTNHTYGNVTNHGCDTMSNCVTDTVNINCINVSIFTNAMETTGSQAKYSIAYPSCQMLIQVIMNKYIVWFSEQIAGL